MKLNNRVLFSLSGSVIGLVFVYFLAWQIVPKTLVTLTKASTVEKIDLNKSIFIGSKILADADGKDKCTVNVFLVDTSGRGVTGKTISLSGADQISPESAQTDKLGKATFNVTSTTAGQFDLQASVNGVSLPKKLTVTFRK